MVTTWIKGMQKMETTSCTLLQQTWNTILARSCYFWQRPC